ncbi:FecCD family ABC transporter permease [Salinibius halmophilus]|uniref:FecCD family ABC transporter permease n=1 Tax=Salinibius halmophilus TaxID=1853216 RepID=UPI000E67125C|nr:iron ABC transporter permease [Salinibius halmophilus]
MTRVATYSTPAQTMGWRLFIAITCGLLMLLFGIGWSLFVASEFEMGWVDVAHFILGQDGEMIHQHIIKETRLPRALSAAGVGAALALAGLLMQALTRNPLASPSIFGVSAGAAFAFAFAATGLIPWFSALPILATTFIGACIAGVAVFFLAGLYQQNVNPIRVVLAGIALNYLFISLTRAAVIFADEHAYGVLHWLTGSVGNVNWSHVNTLWPALLVGFVLSVYLSFQLNLLALGESMMKSLGGSLWWVRTLAAFTIVLLIAASVSVAGPLAFIGLVIPHICRAFIGTDIRLLVPTVAIFGANLLVYADALAQLYGPGRENPVGIITSLFGALFFLALVRWQVRKAYV